MTEPAVALAAGEARLAVARRGAEAIAWSVGGVELLWPGDRRSGPRSARSSIQWSAGRATARESAAGAIR
jgi:hypothetical protein